MTGIRALISSAKSFFGKLTGKSDATTEALVAKVQETFGTDIATAQKAVAELQKAVNAATKENKNAAKDGDAKSSKKPTPIPSKAQVLAQQAERRKQDEKREGKLSSNINVSSANETMSEHPIVRRNFNRTFIDFNDTVSTQAYISEVAKRIVQDGKAVVIEKAEVDELAKNEAWGEQAPRNAIKKILSQFAGKSVYFHAGDKHTIEAYLTKDGRNHATKAAYLPTEYAVAYQHFIELTQAAQYAYSSAHDEHSVASKNITGDKIWDRFVAVAKIDNEILTVVFTLRQIDRDTRNQIFSLWTESETVATHKDGINIDDGVHSNYRASTVSEESVPQPADSVKENFSSKKPTPIPSKVQVLAQQAERQSKSSIKDGEITIEDVNTLRSIGRKSINDFTSEDIQKSEKWARKFYRELGVKSPFFRAWFGDWRAYDSKTKIAYIPVNTDFTSLSNIPRGEFYNSDTAWNIATTRDGIDETANKQGKGSSDYRALADIDKMLSNAILLDTVVVTEASKRLGEAATFMHHLYCPVNMNGTNGIAKIYVAEQISGAHKFYLTKIEEISTAKVSAQEESIDPRAESTTDEISSTISVCDIFNFVKENDAKFEKNSKSNVRFNPQPVNPVLLNEDGTPKVFYHGTDKQFTVFDPAEMSIKEGSFFFAENREDAKAYGKYAARRR